MSSKVTALLFFSMLILSITAKAEMAFFSIAEKSVVMYDAPSLKAADIGISVSNAVDVAKQSADIVLIDKGLQQLLDGVIEGRKTF